MKKLIHKSEDRGYGDFGWLRARYSFSFARFYNPDRMGFGKLRVLNDDVIDPSEGFDTHPHENMEIITIPLKGELKHTDSGGNSGIIRPGEVQVMSAGSGIFHSEFNASADKELNLLQIWIHPAYRNAEPRYDERRFNPDQWHNHFCVLVSGNDSAKGLTINQNAMISRAKLDAGRETEYQISHAENGAYAFIISGACSIAGERLRSRDAIGISDTAAFTVGAESDCDLIVLDVPM
jgi:redox-sensitive bicupin YhaK (pirin superfamily)